MMATMIRARERVKVGAQCKALLDNKKDLLLDMDLVGPNKLPLRQCWMHGTVTAIKGSKIQLHLPAAEEKVWFTKEHVFPAKNEPEPRKLYVVYDDATIKTVEGLKLSSNYFPKDYYDEKSEAEEAIKRASQKTKKGKSKKACDKSVAPEVKESLQRAVDNKKSTTKTHPNNQVSKILNVFEHTVNNIKYNNIIQVDAATPGATNVKKSTTTTPGGFGLVKVLVIPPKSIYTHHSHPHSTWQHQYLAVVRCNNRFNE